MLVKYEFRSRFKCDFLATNVEHIEKDDQRPIYLKWVNNFAPCPSVLTMWTDLRVRLTQCFLQLQWKPFAFGVFDLTNKSLLKLAFSLVTSYEIVRDDVRLPRTQICAPWVGWFLVLFPDIFKNCTLKTLDTVTCILADCCLWAYCQSVLKCNTVLETKPKIRDRSSSSGLSPFRLWSFSLIDPLLRIKLAIPCLFSKSTVCTAYPKKVQYTSSLTSVKLHLNAFRRKPANYEFD